MDSLIEYEGLYSDDTYGSSYQKTGIIYKKDMISVLSRDQIYEERDYEFPRPPLVLKLSVSRNGYSNEFYLIIVHLKAYQGEEELDRRRGAVRLLKEYMDSEISTNEEKDYIIAGDWNDELTDLIGGAMTDCMRVTTLIFEVIKPTRYKLILPFIVCFYANTIART